MTANKKVNIAAIKPNEENPRYITDAKFKKLIKSIKEFPEMLETRPLVVDENMVVLGGNMRLKALKSAGVFEVPVHQVKGWTEEKKKEFIIKDNVGYGEWDWDIIANEWKTGVLNEWGLDLPVFDADISNTNDYTDLDVESKLEKFLDAKIKNLTIPFESNEFDDVVLRLELYLEKYDLKDYKSFIYKVLENENL